MTDETDNGQILEAGIKIRHAREAARAVDDYVGSMRLALEDVQASNVGMVRKLRDEMVEVQTKTLESQQAMIDQVAELVALLADRLSEPLVVNVPQTELKMDQQPVTINIPKSAIEVKMPAINIPEPHVVIQGAERKLPRRLKIKHSDGTSSSVEFEPGG